VFWCDATVKGAFSMPVMERESHKKVSRIEIVWSKGSMEGYTNGAWKFNTAYEDGSSQAVPTILLQ
jgi:hypothetical protein